MLFAPKAKSREAGQGLVEYALILIAVALIVICCVAACWLAVIGIGALVIDKAK